MAADLVVHAGADVISDRFEKRLSFALVESSIRRQRPEMVCHFDAVETLN